jgi:hypothetical protein
MVRAKATIVIIIAMVNANGIASTSLALLGFSENF